jgi:hypothetical protein
MSGARGLPAPRRAVWRGLDVAQAGGIWIGLAGLRRARPVQVSEVAVEVDEMQRQERSWSPQQALPTVDSSQQW